MAEIPLGATISVLEKIDVQGGDKFRFVYNNPPYPIPFFELKKNIEDNYGKITDFEILSIWQDPDTMRINMIVKASHGTPFILIFGVLVIGAGLLGWILKMQLQEVYKIIDNPVTQMIAPAGIIVVLAIILMIFKKV